MIPCYVVNARHIKNVLGRKTDVSDSEWLAELDRCGLLRPNFVPPKDFKVCNKQPAKKHIITKRNTFL